MDFRRPQHSPGERDPLPDTSPCVSGQHLTFTPGQPAATAKGNRVFGLADLFSVLVFMRLQHARASLSTPHNAVAR